jgi:hypothetical protein
VIAKAKVMRQHLLRQYKNEKKRMKGDVTQTGVAVSGRRAGSLKAQLLSLK